jgi:transposase InsO family protein
MRRRRASDRVLSSSCSIFALQPRLGGKTRAGRLPTWCCRPRSAIACARSRAATSPASWVSLPSGEAKGPLLEGCRVPELPTGNHPLVTTGNPSRAIQQTLTRAGFLFLAIVLDVFSRRVIGWAMGQSAELRLGRREGGRRLPGPQPHLRLAGAVGIERGDVVAQPQAAII